MVTGIRTENLMAPPPNPAERIRISCRDGVQLGGHLWRTNAPPQGFVVINAATGVLARYYHFYASFLAAQGYDVLTYDYRGIGLSRPQRLRGCGYRWRDWGQLDFDAAICFAAGKRRAGPLLVVGHSVGGFLPGLAESAPLVERMLTVGAQYAYWPDYARDRRLPLVLKWHVAMPVLTALCGYFPGKRLGWLEDLPAGVANEWSFKGRRTEASYPPQTRAEVLARFAAFRAPILAIAVSDDELGTPRAIRRTLAYYTGAERQQVVLTPSNLGVEAVGHFALFHTRFADSFWPATVRWLRDGINPWANPAERPQAEPMDV